MSWTWTISKLDDELAKLRMSSMSWVSCTVSSMLAKLSLLS